MADLHASAALVSLGAALRNDFQRMLDGLGGEWLLQQPLPDAGWAELRGLETDVAQLWQSILDIFDLDLHFTAGYIPLDLSGPQPVAEQADQPTSHTGFSWLTPLSAAGVVKPEAVPLSPQRGATLRAQPAPAEETGRLAPFPPPASAESTRPAPAATFAQAASPVQPAPVIGGLRALAQRLPSLAFDGPPTEREVSTPSAGFASSAQPDQPVWSEPGPARLTQPSAPVGQKIADRRVALSPVSQPPASQPVAPPVAATPARRMRGSLSGEQPLDHPEASGSIQVRESATPTRFQREPVDLSTPAKAVVLG